MKLINKNQTNFELDIAGYQYPGMETEEYDSNWLMIRIKVKHSKGEWQSTDPSLLTYEAKELAQWLEKIGRNEPVEEEMAFIEPNLSFSLAEKNKYLRIYFELESRPSWAACNWANKGDLWLDIEIENNNLLEAAGDLNEQLLNYPQRAAV